MPDVFATRLARLQSASRPPTAEAKERPSRSDDRTAQTESTDLDARVDRAKRKLKDHEDQIRPKRVKMQVARRDQAKAAAELEKGKNRLKVLQNKAKICTARLETQEKEIAGDESKTQSLEEDLARIELERKVATRKASRLDVEDWEVEHLTTLPCFQNPYIRKMASAWVNGTAADSSKQYVKTVVISALVDTSEAKIVGLVKKLLPSVKTVEPSTSPGMKESLSLSKPSSDSDFRTKQLCRRPMPLRDSTLVYLNPSDSDSDSGSGSDSGSDSEQEDSEQQYGADKVHSRSNLLSKPESTKKRPRFSSLQK